MDVSYLLDSLNDKQREAVAAPRSNLLVLAGAGSGKTRVLVHRIAWLMSVENCSPYSIMAVTFTNKAAAEMRGGYRRADRRQPGRHVNATFHDLAHRLLRLQRCWTPMSRRISNPSTATSYACSNA
ncbi:UvrD-helicase domain-containing protein [Escherichia coli]|uniref:UvrD-helicase domain-containing protein n=1 Tax=Escherichia coli TaxID=562 RepID=UPI003F5E5F82